MVEINTTALWMSQGRYVLAFFVSFLSFGKRMTTDIFIYRRVCLFYLKTTRNYSSFKQLFAPYFEQENQQIEKLAFYRKDVAKNKYKKKADEGEDTKKSNSFS